MSKRISKENIKPPAPPNEEQLKEDQKSTGEYYQYEEEGQKALLERVQLLNTGLKQDIKERKDYANRLFWLIVCWLVLVLFLILMQGFSFYNFELQSDVILAIITGLSVNVLGIFIIVATYLFPKDKRTFKERVKDLTGLYNWVE